MSKIRVANKNCRRYVDAKIPFQGSHLFGEELNARYYVVYSYGYHFPMWVFDRQEMRWIGTDSKYSRSTTRHQSQSRPTEDVRQYWHVEGLKGLLFGRLAGTVNA